MDFCAKIFYNNLEVSMNLNSTISSMDIKLKGKGVIISYDTDMTPRVIPTPADYCGIDDMGHILYIMARDIIYKFECENFNLDKFQETRKFIKAYHQNVMQRKPWFPSVELRKLRKEPSQFFKIFKFTLKEDLQRYHGPVAQGLVQDLLKELEKVSV